jgi:hypothetical protein
MTNDYIWFKTRVGLASVTGSVEFLAWNNTKLHVWYVYARIKAWPELSTKSIWGRSASTSAPVIYLAFFTDGPEVSKAVGECMARIEDAVRTKAELCDLSKFGDAEAWRKKWEVIQWPTANPDA